MGMRCHIYVKKYNIIISRGLYNISLKSFALKTYMGAMNKQDNWKMLIIRHDKETHFS